MAQNSVRHYRRDTFRFYAYKAGEGHYIARCLDLLLMGEGKTLEEAKKISNVAVAEALGGLPPVKMHCSVLAEEALESALQDYYKKNGIAPMVRILSKVTGFKLKHIYELFPSGPGKGACKMAGLAKPTGCV